MTAPPVWQTNYVDLWDERIVRYGASCLICDARYASPGEQVPPDWIVSPPDAATAQLIADARRAAYIYFDGDYREMLVHCYRCGRQACPECWDADNRMCGECVAARGLARSPRNGQPTSGPLADGRLRLIEPGRYSDAERPAWLKQLVATQHRTGAPIAQGRVSSTASTAVAPLPFEDASGGQFSGTRQAYEAALAAMVETAKPSAPLDAPHASIEGSTTSNTVECPRCHSANYDFVTRCTTCRLQLIQNCPACGMLNAGHLVQCESCHAPLDRPVGWSGVQGMVVSLPADVAPTPLRFDEAPTRAYAAPQYLASGGAFADAAEAYGYPADDGATGVSRGSKAKRLRAGSMPRSLAEQPEFAHASGGVARTLERMLSTVALLAILLVVVALVSAEVSPLANATLRGWVHVDVRLMVSHFAEQMLMLWQRVQH